MLHQPKFSAIFLPDTSNKHIAVYVLITSLLSALFLYTSPANADTIPDFSSMSVQDRKQEFIDTLLPLIYAENKHIDAQRSQLRMLSQSPTLSTRQNSWLKMMAKTYRVPLKSLPPSSTWFKTMLTKADSLPPSLVLVQAANESAWGTSRFARDGNNYFGMWCYTDGCGLVPKKRDPGKVYEVQKFPSIQASISAYYNNINTNTAYAKLRTIRTDERTKNIPLDSLKIIQGLSHYSQRGEAYVTSLSQWIKNDNLQKYDLYNKKGTEYIPYYQHAADLYDK